jgi:hypothetical protein
MSFKKRQLPKLVLILIAALWSASLSAVWARQSRSTAAKTEATDAPLADEQQAALGLLRHWVNELKGEPDSVSAARLQARAADVIWKFDEAEARVAFRLAFDNARRPLPAGSELSEREKAERNNQVRRQAAAIREVLRRFGARDGKAAQVWLQELEEERAQGSTLSAKSAAERAELLAQLALELVAADPEKAGKLGLLSLSGETVPSSFGRLLFALSNLDRGHSDKLFRAALANLRRNGFAHSPALFSLANYVSDQGGRPLPEALPGDLRLLIDYLCDAAAALSTPWREARQVAQGAASDRNAQLYNFLIARGLTLVERNSPDRQPLIRTLLGDLRAGLSGPQLEQAELLLAERGRELAVTSEDESDAEKRLERAEQEKDSETRDLLLRQLALSLMRDSSERALSIAARIGASELRAQTEDDVNLSALSAKLRGHEYTEARRFALKLNNLGLRAKMFALLAKSEQVRNKDAARAYELLNEAYLLTMKSEDSLSKLEAFLLIAEGFVAVDAVRGFETLSAAVRTLNQLGKQNRGLKTSLDRKPSVRIVTFISINDEEVSAGETVTVDSINFNQVRALTKSDYAQAIEIGQRIEDRLMRAKFFLAVAEGTLNSSEQRR